MLRRRWLIAAALLAHVEGIEVCASAWLEEEHFTECATTKSGGAYEILGLPEGNYRVKFTSGESGLKLVTQYWHDASTPSAATLVQIHERQAVTGIDAELQRAGSALGATGPHGHHRHHGHHHHGHHHGHGHHDEH